MHALGDIFCRLAAPPRTIPFAAATTGARRSSKDITTGSLMLAVPSCAGAPGPSAKLCRQLTGTQRTGSCGLASEPRFLAPIERSADVSDACTSPRRICCRGRVSEETERRTMI